MKIAFHTPPKLLYYTQITLLGLIVGLGLQFVEAWTAPGGTPPNGNVSGPLTTSVTSQTKVGGLVLGGLSLTSYANCDLKTNALGVVTCGTDATGGGADAGRDTQITSYNLLPTGATAGYCRQPVSTTNILPAYEPAYDSNGSDWGGQCLCRAGFTLVHTGSKGSGTNLNVSFTHENYTCIKN